MPIHKKRIIILIASISIIILSIPLMCVGGMTVDDKFSFHSVNSLQETNNWYAAAQENAVATSDSAISSKSNADQASKADNKSKISRAHNKINHFALWLMGDLNVFEFKSQMIRFGDNYLPSYLNQPYKILLERTYTYPIVFFFIIFILLMLLNVSFVLLIMYLSSERKNHKERYIMIYRNSYEDVFRSYLFGEIDWDRAFIKLKKKKKRLNRKILTDVLLVFKENLRGEMDAQLSQIFKNLGLHEDSMRMLKSVFYHRKIEGMKALTNLDPESAKELIPNYLNNSHFQVRTEAQVSYVRLHPEQPFEFLKDLTSPFPRWTQLLAFHIFRLHQVPVPAFIDYIESGVPTVRNFSLRMIIFFQQLENASAIYKLLDSPYEMTRFLAIRAINDLRLFEGKQKIKEMYPSETGNNKIEIIKALKNIGDNDDFDFLESIIQTGTVSLKVEACRSLYYVNPIGKYRLKALSQNSELNIDEYLAHVTDPRN